ESPDGRADHDLRADVELEQRPQHADLTGAAQPASAQHESDLRGRVRAGTGHGRPSCPRRSTPTISGAGGAHETRSPRAGGRGSSLTLGRRRSGRPGAEAGGGAVSSGVSARPWVANYPSGVPSSLAPYPAETLYDGLRRSAERFPDATAVSFLG